MNIIFQFGPQKASVELLSLCCGGWQLVAHTADQTRAARRDSKSVTPPQRERAVPAMGSKAARTAAASRSSAAWPAGVAASDASDTPLHVCKHVRAHDKASSLTARARACERG